MIGTGSSIAILLCIIVICMGICAWTVKRKNTSSIYAHHLEMRRNATPGIYCRKLIAEFVISN